MTREMAEGGMMPREIINWGEAKRRPRGRLRVEASELQTLLTDNLALLDKLAKKGAYFELSDEALEYYNEVVEKEVFDSPDFANVKAFGGRYLNYTIAFADINLVSEALGEYSKLSDGVKTSISRLVQLVQLVELVEVIAEEGKETTASNTTNPTNCTNQLTDRMIVQKRHVQRAWAFLKPCLISASELVTYVDMGKPLARVREYIKTNGQNGQKVYHSDMMRMANVDAREAELAIRSLREREEIEQGIELCTAKNSRQTKKLYYLWVRTEEPNQPQQTQPTPKLAKTKEMFDWCKVFRQANPIPANGESPIPEKDEGYDPLVLCETGKEPALQNERTRGNINEGKNQP